MSRKDKAISFLKMAAFGDVQAAYDKFIAPNFIHHNQYFKGDRQTLLDAMADAHKSHPNETFEVKKVLEEGDTVMTLSSVTKADMNIAVVHIFRFEGEKVAEMWDLGQVLDANSPNENGAI